MKNFQIMRYLKKLLPIIVVFCVLATYVINTKLKSSNTFVASEVIHYNDLAAEQGQTPTGDKLDVNEIKSSAVMSKLLSGSRLSTTPNISSVEAEISCFVPSARELLKTMYMYHVATSNSEK